MSIRGTQAAKWDKDTWGPLEDLATNHPEAGVHFQGKSSRRIFVALTSHTVSADETLLECQIHSRGKDKGSATADWFAELLSPTPWFKNTVPNVSLVPRIVFAILTT